MKEKNVVPEWISAILMVLCIASIILCSFALVCSVGTEFGILKAICNGLRIIAIIFAILYCGIGYKKNGAEYYKLTLGSFALVSLFSALVEIATSLFFAAACDFIGLVFIAALALVKNLGKDLSMIFSGLILVQSIIELMFYAVKMGMNQQYSFAVSIMMNGVIIFILVYGKYQDKDSRGAK